MQTGRNYITSEDDLPMIVKVVLSTAPIERVTIFDLLLAHEGVLNVNEITQSLRLGAPTARKTMLELDILGLVDKNDDVNMVCSDGIVRKGSEIRLKDEFQWFLSEEFTNLRQGFRPTKEARSIEVDQEEEAIKEKYPPPAHPTISDRIEESTSQSKTQMPQRGEKFLSPP